ncbi:MAG: hypothetical protein AAB250_07785, partial [Bdellovibrionota bacterium]
KEKATSIAVGLYIRFRADSGTGFGSPKLKSTLIAKLLAQIETSTDPDAAVRDMLLLAELHAKPPTGKVVEVILKAKFEHLEEVIDAAFKMGVDKQPAV